MKTNMTMTKNETIKYINTVFSILNNAKDMISMIIGNKKENNDDGKFGIENIKTEINKVKNIFESGKNGGCGNDYYRIDVSFKNDEMSIDFFMRDDMIIDFINVYAKAIKSCGAYLIAFAVSHMGELTQLMEVINNAVESSISQDLAVMAAKYDIDSIEETCYGFFHTEVKDEKPEEEKEEKTDEVVANTGDEILDNIMNDIIEDNKKLKEENEKLKAKNKMLVGKMSMENHNIDFDSLQSKITAMSESLEEAEESEERDSTEISNDAGTISDVDDMSKTLEGWTRI